MYGLPPKAIWSAALSEVEEVLHSESPKLTLGYCRRKARAPAQRRRARAEAQRQAQAQAQEQAQE